MADPDGADAALASAQPEEPPFWLPTSGLDPVEVGANWLTLARKLTPFGAFFLSLTGPHYELATILLQLVLVAALAATFTRLYNRAIDPSLRPALNR